MSRQITIRETTGSRTTPEPKGRTYTWKAIQTRFPPIQLEHPDDVPCAPRDGAKGDHHKGRSQGPRPWTLRAWLRPSILHTLSCVYRPTAL